jgi:tripartite-type tricarboxylate transporter receptor subunit TctC
MSNPSVKQRLEGLGATLVSADRTTPDYLASFVKSEIQRWAAPIKASGVTID